MTEYFIHSLFNQFKAKLFQKILKVIQLLVYDVAVAVAVIKVMRCCNSSRKKDQSLVSNQLFFPSFVAIFIFRCFQLLYSTVPSAEY